MTTLKAVIFDIGGVLAYDVWEHLLFDKPDGICATLSLNPEKVYQAAKVLWDNYSYYPANTLEECNQLEVECWTQFSEKLGLLLPPSYFIEFTNRFIQPVPGMRQIVEELRAAGLELLICSNNNEFFFKRQMSMLCLEDFFPDHKKIILSSRVRVSKSDLSLQMFRAVIDAMSCRPEECLFIDDRDENIERATECQIPTILFPTEAAFGAAYLRLLLRQFKVLPA